LTNFTYRRDLTLLNATASCHN